MYALVGLREIEPVEFEAEIQQIEKRPFKVVTLATEQQGALMAESSKTLCKEIRDGRFARFVDFCRNHDLQEPGRRRQRVGTVK